MMVERRHPGRLAWTGELVRFGGVGVVGFVVNVATVYRARELVGLYTGGLVAWVFAATVTWSLNRAWTFKGRSTIPLHRQWVLFLATNLVGFVLYYATYSVLVSHSSLCAAQPITAVFAGTIAGLFANFTLSRRLVFR